MDTLPPNLDQVPALPPPPGETWNLDSGRAPSQTAIMAVAGIFLPLMLLAVITRVYVRTRIIKIWGIEDTICILAACGSIANIGMYLNAVSLGMGKHSWNVPITVVMSATNLRVLSPNVTYLFAVCFAKLSILFLYRRLFPVHREKIFIWIGIIMNIVLSTTFMALSIANLIECIKFTSGVTAFCRFVHEEMVLWVTASNVFTDFYIAILPIPRVLNLQTSKRRKFGLCLTFASGLCACGASVARLVHTCRNLYNPDAFWASADLAIYSIIEVNIGIIVACVCTFPVFFRTLRDSPLSKAFSSSVRSLLGSPRRGSKSDESGGSVPLNDKQRPAVLVNSISSGESNGREMRKFDPRGSLIGAEVGYRVDVHQEV
ncbi:hypothetical protein ASPCAL05146 [Aspergillus calidoustus]|uniref:Rhodopsin domain-containing protein n=1 Tax=Aspergillus calidoustus TaxID=454130 RepID=A0A0U5C6H3_ASPCI|nr:hypothetical protein ASPCAL05146 [Aspergillus calidoustus]